MAAARGDRGGGGRGGGGGGRGGGNNAGQNFANAVTSSMAGFLGRELADLGFDAAAAIPAMRRILDRLKGDAFWTRPAPAAAGAAAAGAGGAAGGAAGVVVAHGLMTLMDGLRDRAAIGSFLSDAAVDDAAKEKATEALERYMRYIAEAQANGKDGIDAVTWANERIQADRERPDFQALMRHGLLGTELPLMRGFLVLVTLDPAKEHEWKRLAAKVKSGDQVRQLLDELVLSYGGGPAIVDPAARLAAATTKVRELQTEFSPILDTDEKKTSYKQHVGNVADRLIVILRSFSPEAATPRPSPVKDIFARAKEAVEKEVKDVIHNPERATTAIGDMAQGFNRATTASAGALMFSMGIRSQIPKVRKRHWLLRIWWMVSSCPLGDWSKMWPVLMADDPPALPNPNPNPNPQNPPPNP